MTIELDKLRGDRDALKHALRELEAEQRQIETQLKKLRQREIRTKREIDALGTLIEMHPDSEAKDADKDIEAASASASA